MEKLLHIFNCAEGCLSNAAYVPEEWNFLICTPIFDENHVKDILIGCYQ